MSFSPEKTLSSRTLRYDRKKYRRKKKVPVSFIVDQGRASVFIDGVYRRNSHNDFIRENFGLGCSLLRIGDIFRFASSVLPLDEENVRLTWWFTAPRASGGIRRARSIARRRRDASWMHAARLSSICQCIQPNC